MLKTVNIQKLISKQSFRIGSIDATISCLIEEIKEKNKWRESQQPAPDDATCQSVKTLYALL